MVLTSTDLRAGSKVIFCSVLLLTCTPPRFRKIVGSQAVGPATYASIATRGGSREISAGNAGSGVAPLPMLEIEPADLTSMAASVSLRVTLQRGSGRAPRVLLGEIAAQVRLVDLANGSSMPITTEIHEAEDRAHSEIGYPTSIPAYVAVKSSAVLEPERWYDLRVAKLPDGVAAAKLGLRQLEDGGVSARFSPGSHPTLVSAQRCVREDGTSSVHLNFSESVKSDVGIREKVLLESEEGVGCQLSLPPSGIARTLHFNCAGGINARGRFRIWVGQAVESPSGGTLEIPQRGRGDFSTRVSEETWKPYDQGCSIVAF